VQASNAIGAAPLWKFALQIWVIGRRPESPRLHPAFCFVTSCHPVTQALLLAGPPACGARSWQSFSPKDILGHLFGRFRAPIITLIVRVEVSGPAGLFFAEEPNLALSWPARTLRHVPRPDENDLLLGRGSLLAPEHNRGESERE